MPAPPPNSSAPGRARRLLRRLLPEPARARLHERWRRLRSRPRVGAVDFGSLRRTTPLSRSFGAERGTPVDRFYIDSFFERLGERGGDENPIRGRVLEIGGTEYSTRFGAREGVDRVDVLDIDPDNPAATIVADLADGDGIPESAFDCVVCPQTLLLVYDLRAAVAILHRVLRPGGTVLATLPGVSQICRSPTGAWDDYWRFTPASARRLFEESFSADDVDVGAYGNVLSATAFLYGVALEELERSELEAGDPDYPMLITVEAVKTAGSRSSTGPGAAS